MLFTQLIRWMNKMSRALKMKHTLCIVEESDYNMYHLTTGYVIHKLVVIREFEMQKSNFVTSYLNILLNAMMQKHL